MIEVRIDYPKFKRNKKRGKIKRIFQGELDITLGPPGVEVWGSRKKDQRGRKLKRVAKICGNALCGKAFEVWPCRNERAKYCSVNCQKAALKAAHWRSVAIEDGPQGAD